MAAPLMRRTAAAAAMAAPDLTSSFMGCFSLVCDAIYRGPNRKLQLVSRTDHKVCTTYSRHLPGLLPRTADYCGTSRQRHGACGILGCHIFRAAIEKDQAASVVQLAADVLRGPTRANCSHSQTQV